MLTPDQLYPVLERLLQSSRLINHATARTAVARLLATLLVCQDMRPSAFVRILPAPCARAARHRFGSVRRAVHRQGLTSGALTPFLIRAAMAWVRQAGHAPTTPGQRWLLALDSVRCGPWEVFTVGVVVPGRAIPVAWAVLPYPWPRGRFRPTVDQLVARVVRCWPPDAPVCLLADRAFPAKSFFRALGQGGADWTVRLQSRHYVTRADGSVWQIGQILATADPRRVTLERVTFGAGADAVSGFLVITGRGFLVVPAHQRGPASMAIRARQGSKRHKDRARRRAGTTQGPSRDEWLVLFTTETNPLVALEQYGQRWAIEGTYRDLQGGWDGQHGWHFDRVIVRCGDSAEVDARVGFWALGALVQIGLGLGLSRADAPAAVRAAMHGWATTDRLSWWWRGRCALASPEPALRAWIPAHLTTMADVLDQAPGAIIPFERPTTPMPMPMPKAA